MAQSGQNINQIINNHQNYDVNLLPSSTIEDMIEETRKEQNIIIGEIQKYGEEMVDAKQQGLLLQMEAARNMIISLRDSLDKLKDHSLYLDECFKHKRLDEKVITALGSEKRSRYLDYFIIALTFATIGIVVLEIFFHLSEDSLFILNIADTLICIAFLAELLWRMQFADSKWWYFKRNWILFLASIPLGGIVHVGLVARVLEFERLVRVISIVRVFRVVRIFSLFSRFSSFLGLGATRRPLFLSVLIIFLGRILSSMQVKRIVRLITLTVIVIVFGGLMIAYLGGTYDKGVSGPWQGTWWSFVTVITGDFANIYNPQHSMERVITVLLVLIGMILSSSLTGSLASILMEDNTDRIERQQTVIQLRLEEIMDKLEKMDKEMREIRKKIGTN